MRKWKEIKEEKGQMLFQNTTQSSDLSEVDIQKENTRMRQKNGIFYSTQHSFIKSLKIKIYPSTDSTTPKKNVQDMAGCLG